ncbi:hypothetical protein QAD02_009180 [Eretmocerus hayati]|uniref:Uncharacterized protein n=1 Tax=Eretmocerus hayati TaxID=131215 RepID=A0ACC2N8Q2_9HYME|nr:hypothetical protein QAD02_009180 [Eretmocerus hayati]
MVLAAIKGLADKKGSSLQAIKKYIAAHYKCDVEKQSIFIRKFLKSAVAKKTITQTKGSGAAGSFKLAPKAEGVKKVAKKPAAKKAAGAKKPAAAKKPKAAKKPSAAKKAASPKKPKAVKPKVAKPKSPKKEKKAKAPAKPKAPKPKKTAAPKAAKPKPAKK